MSNWKWTNGRNVVVPLAIKHTAPWVLGTRTLTNTDATLLRWHIHVTRKKISRCYFQNYPHNLVPPCESSRPPKDLKWEPKERVMTLLCGEKKILKILESFVLGKKSSEEQVNEAGCWCSWRQREFNQRKGEDAETNWVQQRDMKMWVWGQ